MRSTITLVWNQMRHHDRRCGGIVTASRLLVTYLDCDMEFVWTLKYLDKASRQRSSAVQIKPPQPKILLFQSLPQSLQPSECVWPQGRFEKITCRLSFSASCSGIT